MRYVFDPASYRSISSPRHLAIKVRKMETRMEHKIVVIVTVLAMLSSLAACAQSAIPTLTAVPNAGHNPSPTPTQPGLPVYWPTEGWRTAPPEALRMNPDKLEPAQRCASTSNRNFEGRQGKGGRTHLVSPAMAAAAAATGHFVDIRDWKYK